ncbi:PucR family transcriptional regulator [Actinomadura sp. SCN-SB]|uniref:PucR family transcriptional regulator n=1 Tax=Actinomadura sp. SCN-SB TaxID=3373092 RepID=UPI003752CB34
MSPDIALALRPHLESAAAEMVREIQALVPEYARPEESRYGQRMRWVVEQTVGAFIEAIGRPETSWDEVAEIFAEIGAYEARKGRGLEGLQTSIRVCGQVACRRFIQDARRLAWNLDTLGHITESLFVFLERIAAAAGRGHAAARQVMATERERARSRLRDLLIMEPHASRDAITDLARTAGWDVPRSLAAVAVRRPDDQPVPILPPEVLAHWHCAEPYLIVPDPDGPGRDHLVDSLVGDSSAAVGPTAGITEAGMSLRWARRTLALVERGVLPAKGTVRCLDHVPILAGVMSEELLGVAMRERLAPLLDLPPQRRDPLVRTLLVYMENRDNAVAAAERLVVHEQTVRYRIRRLEQLLGPLPCDPEHRLEVMFLLHTWSRLHQPGGTGRAPGQEDVGNALIGAA